MPTLKIGLVRDGEHVVLRDQIARRGRDDGLAADQDPSSISSSSSTTAIILSAT
jgi:hypothetical protein